MDDAVYFEGFIGSDGPFQRQKTAGVEAKRCRLAKEDPISEAEARSWPKILEGARDIRSVAKHHAGVQSEKQGLVHHGVVEQYELPVKRRKLDSGGGHKAGRGKVLRGDGEGGNQFVS